MPLGATSLARLSTCHPDLQVLIQSAAAGIDEGDLAYAGIRDMAVLCGHRGEADQHKAYAVDKTSKTPWPRSKHNRKPSDAVDVAPYPIPLKADGSWDEAQFAVLHAYIAGIAHEQGLDLFDISWDRPHIQRNVP